MSYIINPNAKNRWARNAENTMDLSLETDASSVYLDNGRTLEQEIGEGSMVSNVATVDSGMEKVIDDTYDGAYESCKMYGKSLVNLMTKEIDTTWNLNLTKWSIVSTSPSDFILKPNTTYSVIVYVTEKTCSDRDDLFWVGDIDGGKNKITHDIVRKNVSLGTNVFVINTVSDFSNLPSTKGGIGFQGSKFVEGTLKWKAIVLEGDWTDKELPPYFTGLCDVKAPILKNVGKNLFNIANHTENQWTFSNGYPYEQVNTYEDRLKILNNEIHFTTDGTTVNKGVGYYIPLCKNKDYTLNINKKSGNNFCVKVFLIHPSEKPLRQYIHDISRMPVNSEVINTKTFKANFNSTNYEMCAIYIGGGWENGATGTRSFVFNNISLTQSSDNTTHEPYKTNILETSNDIVLRGLPEARLGEYNACDSYDCLTGEHTQHIGEIVFDGSDDESWTWREERDGITGFTINMPNDMFHSGLVNVTEGFISNVASAYRKDYSICMGYLGTRTICLWTSTSTISQVSELKTKLSQNPITIQYKLAEPIVTTIEPSTTPFAYENGHIILESGHEGQSLLPTLEYSTVINKTGQIENVAKTIQRQEKQLTMLEQMLIQNIINLDYNNTLLTLKNEMEEML